MTTLYCFPPASRGIGSPLTASSAGKSGFSRTAAFVSETVNQSPRILCAGGLFESHSIRNPEMTGKRLNKHDIKGQSDGYPPFHKSKSQYPSCAGYIDSADSNVSHIDFPSISMTTMVSSKGSISSISPMVISPERKGMVSLAHLERVEMDSHYFMGENGSVAYRDRIENHREVLRHIISHRQHHLHGRPSYRLHRRTRVSRHPRSNCRTQTSAWRLGWLTVETTRQR